MQLSQKGERFLMNAEGFKKNKQGLHIPYKCPAGKWTLGYGEVITEDQAEEFKDGIPEDQAVARFRKKLQQFIDAVNKRITQQLTQGQFDALVSLCYNIGVGAFQGSTIVKMINNRQFTNAADQFVRWNKVNGQPCEGLTKRRLREKAMYLGL